MRYLTNLFNMFFSDNTKKVTAPKDIAVNAAAPKSNKMRLLLNDPLTPDLVLETDLILPPDVCPSFSVKGFSGPTTQMWTGPWRAAQAYCVYLNTLHTMQGGLQKQVRKWPGTSNLKIIPYAGDDLNAYYDRQGLFFFAAEDPVTKKPVHTVDSTDIVAHELGHAILDAIRPDLWNMQALEVWSFHEAWADLTAILTVMKYDDVLKHAIKETGGDMLKSSIISRLAEQMGYTIYNITKGKDGRSNGALRDAVNTFTYSVPEKLPRRAPDNQLAAECHSFGRVFLGAYYEVMNGMYIAHRNEGRGELEAMREVRNDAARLLGHAAQIAPASPRFYDSVARTMITIDRQWGGKYNQLLNNVFNSRKIISKRSIKALSAVKLDDVLNDDNVVHEGQDGTKLVRVVGNKNLKLSDHFGIKAQADNPLYECEIEVPNETFLEFGADGKLSDSIAVSERIAVNAARDCIKYLHDEKMYSIGEPDVAFDQYMDKLGIKHFTKQFAILENKLVRKFFI